MAAALFAASGCATRLYEGPPLPREQVAVIHAGTTIVRGIDGKPRRGGVFDASELDVTPGAHRLVLVFERPARSLGLKALPAQAGVGTCVLELTAAAGKHYFLGSRVRGEINDPRWDGAWEGWVRDPTVSSDDDVIARCESQEAGEEPPPAAVAVAPPPPVAAPVAAPSPAAPPAGAALRLGAWSPGAHGHGGEAETARSAAAIAANFDLVTIAATRPEYDALRRALAPAWDGLITDAPRPAGGAYYAVLYRPDRVRPCAGWEALRYRPASDGDGARVAAPAADCFAAEVLEIPGLDRLPISVRLGAPPSRR
jgi:hypothetical protein